MALYDVTGTIADWIMAGAAAYAAWNAKSWFSQRSHTTGFDKAEEILHKIDSFYLRTQESVLHLHSELEYLNAVSYGSTNPDESFLKKYEDLKEKHDSIIDEIRKLRDEIKLIERWSISLRQKSMVNQVVDALSYANNSASLAYSNARGCIYNIKYMGKEEFDVTLVYYKKYYEEFLKDLILVERHYQLFVSIKFTKMFKIK